MGRDSIIEVSETHVTVRPPLWWTRLRQLRARAMPYGGAPSPTAPTFVWPAVSAVRWAVAWGAAMLATAPDHHTWQWLFLLPFMVHTWRALRRLHIFVTNRSRIAAGLAPLQADGSYPPLRSSR